MRYISSDYDERLLNIKKETILEGIFQSESYFFGDLKKLKRYIKLNKKIKEENKIEKEIMNMNFFYLLLLKFLKIVIMDISSYVIG